MSNVLERFRSVSEMDFYAIGQSLLHETRSFLMNDDVIPKRERSTYTYPIIHLVQAMIDAFTAANRIYAYTTEDVARRKQMFQTSIDYIDPIYQRIQSAMNDLWKDTLCCSMDDPRYKKRMKLEKHLAIIGNLLVDEEARLRGCKNKTKLLNRR